MLTSKFIFVHYVRSEDIKSWKNAIITATHPLSQILIDVIPDIETIVGSQPAIPVLPASENRLRFERVLINFIQVLLFEYSAKINYINRCFLRSIQ